jgi:hypothetical protein
MSVLGSWEEGKSKCGSFDSLRCAAVAQDDSFVGGLSYGRSG